MPKIYQATTNVLEAAKARLREHYEAGDRVVVSSSGGKDSTVILELALQVARECNRLPVDVIMRDEEIMCPGTFEYLERVYRRPEVAMRWVIAGQAIINAFNRYSPYWWVFDPLEQDKWVRQPPAFAEYIPEKNIAGMTTLDRFPPAPGKRLIAVIGLRAQESRRRLNRIASTKGALTKHPTDYGTYNLAPIYDWTDEDVWKAIGHFRWDYNEAYNALYRIGCPRQNLRIAPPSMKQGAAQLKYMPILWPDWFDKVEQRVPGLRAVAYYGRKALKPIRKPGETWEQLAYRLIEDARKDGILWLVTCMERALEVQIKSHAHHSSSPLPMTKSQKCNQCQPVRPGSWQGLAESIYDGDPWASMNQLEPLEPWELRVGMPGWFEDGKKGALHF